MPLLESGYLEGMRDTTATVVPFRWASVNGWYFNAPPRAGPGLVFHALRQSRGRILGRRSSLKHSFALLPFEAAYWVGFALPFGVVLGAARTIAVMPAFGAGGVRACPTSSISCNAGSRRPQAAWVSSANPGLSRGTHRRGLDQVGRGAYMITATPTRQMTAPMMSQRWPELEAQMLVIPPSARITGRAKLVVDRGTPVGVSR